MIIKKKLLGGVLLLLVGIMSPLLPQATSKPVDYYLTLLSACREKYAKNDLKAALGMLQVLPVEDQQVLLNMIQEGLEKNPKEFYFFLPLAIEVGKAKSMKRLKLGLASMALSLLFPTALFLSELSHRQDRAMEVRILKWAAGAYALVSGISVLTLVLGALVPAQMRAFTFKGFLRKDGTK